MRESPAVVKPVEATPHQLALLQMPTIDSEFPIVFKDTGFKMESLHITCRICGNDIPLNHIRGNMSRMLECVVDLDLIGSCEKCGIHTPSNFRINSERKCEWKDSDGVRHSFHVHPPTGAGVKGALLELFRAIRWRIFG